MVKITRAYVVRFDEIEMEQLLPSRRKITVKWHKRPDKSWIPFYSTDSAFHICPYNGQFKDCRDCIAYSEDMVIWDKNCNDIWEKEAINSNEMASRATACANAEDCSIVYRSIYG